MASTFPTAYIKTTTAAATRAADTIKIDGSAFAGIWNPSEGSIVATANSADSLTRSIASFKTDASNRIEVRRRDTNNLSFLIINAGAGQVDTVTGSGWTVNTTKTLGVAYKENNFTASLSGSVAVSDTSGSLPSAELLEIGATLNGHIPLLTYFPRKLTPTQLQQLSALGA